MTEQEFREAVDELVSRAKDEGLMNDEIEAELQGIIMALREEGEDTDE